MESTLALTTLSCNDRQVIFKTVSSFIYSTTISRPVTWYILLQGCTDDHCRRLQEYLEHLKDQYQCPLLSLEMIIWEKNIGLSKAVNRLAQATRHYTYVLHLEDDWICLPAGLSQLPANWLMECWDFMDERPEVGSIFLRKYVNPEEKHKYCWNRPAQYVCHRFSNFNYAHHMSSYPKEKYKHLTLQPIPNFLFTLNPVLRRNELYYQAEVFPLDEFTDAAPDSRRLTWTTTQQEEIPHWGWAESLAMEKIRHLPAYNLHAGIFAHYDDWYDYPPFREYVGEEDSS